MSSQAPASDDRRAPTTKPAGPNARRQELSTGPQAVRTRTKVRKWRTKTGGHAPKPAAAGSKPPKAVLKRRAAAANVRKQHAAAAAVAALPSGLAETAQGRQLVFSPERRGPDAARQKAEREARKLLEKVQWHTDKGRWKEAAAMLAGALRHPALRLLLPAAGVQLMEDCGAHCPRARVCSTRSTPTCALKSGMWYGPKPHSVVVPAEQVLHASFEMRPAAHYAF